MPVRGRADWGALPQFALLNAGVLLALAGVDNAARNGISWAEAGFWLCLIGLYAPIFMRLLKDDIPRGERIGLVLVLGLSLYLVKVMHSPNGFTFHDELVHLRTVNDIALTGHLFKDNTIIQVSPLYPGLHLATAAFAQVTGLGIFTAAVIVLALGRILLVGVLFLLFESASDSPRAAGICTLLYMTTPNFIFFMSQFAYESLALPLAALVIYTVSQRFRPTQGQRVTANVTIVLLILTVAVTHHLTSYMLALFLAASGMIALFWQRIASIILGLQARLEKHTWYRRLLQITLPPPHDLPATLSTKARPGFGWTAGIVIVISLAWMMYVAKPTFEYLEPVFSDAFNEVLKIVQGDMQGRQLFSSTTGDVRPAWEQITSLASVGLAMLILPFGILEVWRRRRDRMVALLLLLTGLAYPLSLGLRFTAKGWEIGNRSSEFLFVGVAYLCGIGLLSTWHKAQGTRWRLIFTAFGVMMLLGGLIAGWPYWARLPGSYLVSADTRSIEAHGVEVAKWASTHLPTDSRMVVDRMNGLLMNGYGNQHAIRGGYDQVFTGALLFADGIGVYQAEILRAAQPDYVLTDSRLTKSLPQLGIYVEIGEPDTFIHQAPLPMSAFAKFDYIAGSSRVFDSGSIVLYDIRVLTDAYSR